jgi:hypothetical protein
MDTTLVMVTLLSMGMAGSLSVIVWRMLRDERQRSEARVAALAGMAARQAPRPRSAIETVSHSPLDLPMRAQAPPATQPMFAEPPASSPWGHRAAVMTGLALVLASVILLALASNAGRTSARSAASASSPAAPAVATAPAGLELISLRDSRKADSLTITGLVRNPHGGSPLARVAVTAYTFDDKGSFLASGRALIDVTSLAPGDESPFVVSVPVTDTVARYRIGFRGDDGHVIAHVDKRQQGPIAANW